MAAASCDIPPEKPELFSYYFEIPENAEVSRVQISMLPSSVQEKIMRLGGNTGVIEAPYVIVVSPIIKQKFPNGHEAAPTASGQSPGTISDHSSDGRSRTRNGLRTYVAPVKCFRDTALDILTLSQASREGNWSLESEFPNISDSSTLNLVGIKMKATALCVYNNIMYLLPDSKDRNMSDGGKEGEVWRSESNASQPEAEPSTNREWTHKGLGSATPRRVSWKLPEESKSTNASPSTSSSTKISFLEPSTKQMKRKLSYDDNSETFSKRNDPSDSDPYPEPPMVQDTGGGSSPQSNWRPSLWSLSPPWSPQESLPHFSPVKSPSSADPEGLSGSHLLYDVLPPVAPASSPIGGDDMSLHHPRATSSPFLPNCSPISEHSQEPSETPSSGDPSPMTNAVGFDHSSLLDLDDTAKEERYQRHLDRVRECERRLEIIRRSQS